MIHCILSTAVPTALHGVRRLRVFSPGNVSRQGRSLNRCNARLPQPAPVHPDTFIARWEMPPLCSSSHVGWGLIVLERFPGGVFIGAFSNLKNRRSVSPHNESPRCSCGVYKYDRLLRWRVFEASHSFSGETDEYEMISQIDERKC